MTDTDGSMSDWMSLGVSWTSSPAAGGGEDVGAGAQQRTHSTAGPGEGFRDGVYYVGNDKSGLPSPLSSANRSISPLSSVGSVDHEPEFPPPVLDAQRAAKKKIKGLCGSASACSWVWGGRSLSLSCR